MSVWAIIPVKPLGRAKSRLAPVLTPEQRFAFAEALLRNTLLKVLDVPEVVGCLVVSRDNYVLSLSRDLGAYTVLESSAQELNGALLRATKVISAWNTDGVVILPADIPLINVDDLTYVIGASAPTTIGRDRSRSSATRHQHLGCASTRFISLRLWIQQF
ncbi:MAG UNVERIFIED_CONTAM: hypothetical protein LVT10_12310 [Anaerolineae bacterium]